jgi:hypothetical protein
MSSSSAEAGSSAEIGKQSENAVGDSSAPAPPQRSMSLREMLTGRFTDFSEALGVGLAYIDELPIRRTERGSGVVDSAMYTLLESKNATVGAYFAIPVAVGGSVLPDDVNELEEIENCRCVLLRLQLKTAKKIYADVITGEELIPGNETVCCTAVAVDTPKQLLGVRGAMLALLKTGGHVDENVDRVGGAPLQGSIGRAAVRASAGSKKRARSSGGVGDAEDDLGDGQDEGEGGGGGGGLFCVRDAMGIDRSALCLNRSKLHVRVRSMNVIFRACSEAFRKRYCGDLLIDGPEKKA